MGQAYLQSQKRVPKIVNGLKIIRRKVTFKQAVTLVTAQILLIIYYTFSAWFTPAIGKKEEIEFEKIHYKALHIVVCDYHQRINRDLISSKTNKLSPRIWCKYACTSSLMNIWMTCFSSSLKETAFQNTSTSERHHGLIYGFDISFSKIGRQITKNWCGGLLSQIKGRWTISLLNKDRIRTLSKAMFYNLEHFNFCFFYMLLLFRAMNL